MITTNTTENLTPTAERNTALESGCATFRGGAAHRELEKTKNYKIPLKNNYKIPTTRQCTTVDAQRMSIVQTPGCTP